MNSIFIVIPILVVLMFLLGTELDSKAFVEVVKSPRSVIIGMIGQIILLPLIAFAIGYLLDLEAAYFMGLVLVACCPGGSSSNVFTMLVKGNIALSVTLTALSSIITLFTLPIIMAFTARFVSEYSGEAITLPVGKLIMQNIVLRPDTAWCTASKSKTRFCQKGKQGVRKMCIPGSHGFGTCILSGTY